METQLVYDNKGKHLALAFKQHLCTANHLTFSVRGQVDTTTGHVAHKAGLRKFFLSKPDRSDSLGTALKKRWKLGAGVTYASDTEQVHCSLLLKKALPLGDPDHWLKLRGVALYDTQTRAPSGQARLMFEKCMFDFSDEQDLRLRVGYDLRVNRHGRVTSKPFGQLRENNWALNTDFNGYWGISYDL